MSDRASNIRPKSAITSPDQTPSRQRRNGRRDGETDIMWNLPQCLLGGRRKGRDTISRPLNAQYGRIKKEVGDRIEKLSGVLFD